MDAPGWAQRPHPSSAILARLVPSSRCSDAAAPSLHQALLPSVIKQALVPFLLQADEGQGLRSRWRVARAAYVPVSYPLVEAGDRHDHAAGDVGAAVGGLLA